ncbi:MAG: diguanylate cyclase [Gammaproteobacteria bacterium]|nr:diguanylate cyclase [Gammaproteobacteria bacterium]
MSLNDIPSDPLTILAVDDTATNLKVISNILSPFYDMKFAKSASIALDILEQYTPDIILLDILMPNIDGYELIKIIKERESTRHTPVIFITSKDSIEDEEKGLLLGAVDYINKPIAPAILKLRISNQLEIIKQRKLLEDLIHVDHLTQIPNRRQFDETLHKEWQRCKRESSSLTLFMIDIDHFKLFNDFYGHAMGDSVLVKVAIKLKELCKRGADFVARWGGEEFVLIVPHINSSQAINMGERICQGIESLEIEHVKSPTSDFVTISVGGLTVLPGSSFELEDKFLSSADEVLYQAKERGRNRSLCTSI